MTTERTINHPRVLDWNNLVRGGWATKYKKRIRIEFLVKYRGNLVFTLTKTKAKDLLNDLRRCLGENDKPNKNT